MISKSVDVASMPDVLAYLASLLEPDTEVILMNGSAPFARLMPMSDSHQTKPDRTPDLYPTMWVSDDFDDLLPGEYWLSEQT